MHHDPQAEHAHGAHVPRDDHAAHAAGGHAGHDMLAGHSAATFRDKFWVSLALTVPTLVWGHLLQSAFGYRAPMVPGARWIPAVFGTAVFAYGGWPFLQGARRELKDRLPGMMTLIALGVSIAFVFSAAVTLGYPGMPLWEELATLVTIMLLGFWLQVRSISQAQGALGELAKLLPNTASRVVNDPEGERIEDVPIGGLRENDLVLVRPGQSIPADGVVASGESDVNEAVLTGESRPVEKTSGAKVIAGTINGSARCGRWSPEPASTRHSPGSCGSSNRRRPRAREHRRWPTARRRGAHPRRPRRRALDPRRRDHRGGCRGLLPPLRLCPLDPPLTREHVHAGEPLLRRTGAYVLGTGWENWCRDSCPSSRPAEAMQLSPRSLVRSASSAPIVRCLLT